MTRCIKYLLCVHVVQIVIGFRCIKFEKAEMPKLTSKILLDKTYKGGWKRLVYQRQKAKSEKCKSPSEDRFVITPCGERIRSSVKLLDFLKKNPKYIANFDPLEVHFESDLGTLVTPNCYSKAIINYVNEQKSKINEDPNSILKYFKEQKSKSKIDEGPNTIAIDASNKNSDKVDDEYELISDIKIEEFPLDSEWMETCQSADSLDNELFKIDIITDFHKNVRLNGDISDVNFFNKIKAEVEPFEDNAKEPEDINKLKQRLISQRLLEIEEILEKKGLNAGDCSQKLLELDDASDEDFHLQNFREIVHELERRFIDSSTRPSSDQMLQWSKEYEIEYELIECYFTKKWNGKLHYENRPKNSVNRNPKFHHVDNLTHILFGQENYEIEIDYAENDI